MILFPKPRLLCCLWLLASIHGCSLWPEAPAPAALHDFGPALPQHQGLPWSTAIVTSPDWLQDTGIDYRLLYARPTERRSYTLDRWVAPPAALLQERFNHDLAAGGPRLRLDLQQFEQIFARPDRAQVVMVLRAAIENGDPTQPIPQQEFRFEAAAPTADAAGALAAFPGLIRKAENALAAWVRQLAGSAGRLERTSQPTH